jgi:thiol-disulfide isomerase/thioredoxin
MDANRTGDRSLAHIRVLVLAVLLATAFAVFAYEERLSHVATADGGPAGAGLRLPEQQGRTWTLSALRGRVVILNFWTSWCEVCQHEAPALEAFAAALQRAGDPPRGRLARTAGDDRRLSGDTG